mmetsp:Transcript_6940/g.17014  ORF Transcript_6940/g.17014 Transcript_6940/m.17014 type:complete len:244 (+) Transcript_6940:3-734(+)
MAKTSEDGTPVPDHPLAPPRAVASPTPHKAAGAARHSALSEGPRTPGSVAEPSAAGGGVSVGAGAPKHSILGGIGGGGVEKPSAAAMQLQMQRPKATSTPLNDRLRRLAPAKAAAIDAETAAPGAAAASGAEQEEFAVGKALSLAAVVGDESLAEAEDIANSRTPNPIVRDDRFGKKLHPGAASISKTSSMPAAELKAKAAAAAASGNKPSPMQGSVRSATGSAAVAKPSPLSGSALGGKSQN